MSPAEARDTEVGNAAAGWTGLDFFLHEARALPTGMIPESPIDNVYKI